MRLSEMVQTDNTVQTDRQARAVAKDAPAFNKIVVSLVATIERKLKDTEKLAGQAVELMHKLKEEANRFITTSWRSGTLDKNDYFARYAILGDIDGLAAKINKDIREAIDGPHDNMLDALHEIERGLKL